MSIDTPWSIIRTTSSRDAALERISEIKAFLPCITDVRKQKELRAEKRRLWKKVRKAERYLHAYGCKVASQD